MAWIFIGIGIFLLAIGAVGRFFLRG